jgi:cytoskeletal protein CcmA (bactofilin family)
VRGNLTVRASGRITGKIRYGEIELERGGRVAGELTVREAGASSATPAAGESGRNGSGSKS